MMRNTYRIKMTYFANFPWQNDKNEKIFPADKAQQRDNLSAISNTSPFISNPFID